MESVLYQQVEASLLENIDQSPFFKLMLDDITIEMKLVVYIRYIRDGKAVVSY